MLLLLEDLRTTSQGYDQPGVPEGRRKKKKKKKKNKKMKVKMTQKQKKKKKQNKNNTYVRPARGTRREK